jgi:hypothetical protein
MEGESWCPTDYAVSAFDKIKTVIKENHYIY